MENTNSSWPEAIEQMVRGWRKQIVARACAHEECSAHFMKWNRIITIPNILFSALLGSMGFTTVTDDKSTEAHRVYTSILSMMIACLTALDNAFSFNVKGAAHASHARTYNKMATTIEVQLVKEPNRREDVNNFVDKIMNSMEQLRETSPQIPTFILKKHPLLINPETTLTTHHRSKSSVVPAPSNSADSTVVNFMTQSLSPKAAVDDL